MFSKVQQNFKLVRQEVKPCHRKTVVENPWSRTGRIFDHWLSYADVKTEPKHRACPLLAGGAPMGVCSSTGAPFEEELEAQEREMHAAVKLEKERQHRGCETN